MPSQPTQPYPPRPRTLGGSYDAIDISTLLDRYPQVSERELDALIRRFAQLPLRDFGRLATDERLATKLDAFYADHGDKLRPPLTPWAIAVPIIIVAAALAYLVVT